MGLVDGELEGGAPGPQDEPLRAEPGDDVEVDLLVVEGDDGAALGQRRRSASTNGEPTTTSAATAQAASSGRCASTAMDSPSALAASPAMRASCPAPTNPMSCVLRSLAPVRGFA